MSSVIIGSGITGLSLGLFLAKQGEKVLILEASPQIAPLLRGFWRRGLFFDTGFHCAGGLQPGGLLHLWLSVLGITERFEPGAVYPVQETISFDDGFSFTMPQSSREFEQAAKEVFEVEEGLFANFLDEMKKIVASSPFTNPVCSELEPFVERSSLSVAEKLWGQFPARLATILATRCFYGIEPTKMSFHEYAFIAWPYLNGCMGLHGGGGTLVKAFCAALEERSVAVRTEAQVTAIEVEKNRVCGVVLASGEKIACESCFFTGSPRNLAALVPHGTFRPAFFSHIQELPETPEGIVLFGATRGETLREKNCYLLKTMDPSALFAPTDTRMLYVAGGGCAHDGRQSVVVIAPARPFLHKTATEYASSKKRATEEILNLINKRLPHLDFTLYDAATAQTMKHRICGSTGSLYGIGHEKGQLPLLPVTRCQGLYLAGQNILMPGLLGCIISAALAAGIAHGFESILREFRQCAKNVWS